MCRVRGLEGRLFSRVLPRFDQLRGVGVPVGVPSSSVNVHRNVHTAETHQDGSDPPRSHSRWADDVLRPSNTHLDRILRVQDHHRIDLDGIRASELEIVPADERSENEEHLHDRQVGPNTLPRPTPERDVGRWMSVLDGFVLEASVRSDRFCRYDLSHPRPLRAPEILHHDIQRGNDE